MNAPGTKADQAIEYLRRAGSATAAEIARAIGIEPKNTVSSLQGAIDAGGIEVNLVSRPGQPPHKVYRLGPNANGWRAYKPPKPTIVPRPAVVEGSGVRVVAHKPAREAKPIQPARAAKAPAAQPKVARNVGSRSPKLDTRPPPGDAAVAAGPPKAVPAASSPKPERASVPAPAAAAARTEDAPIAVRTLACSIDDQAQLALVINGTTYRLQDTHTEALGDFMACTEGLWSPREFFRSPRHGG